MPRYLRHALRASRLSGAQRRCVDVVIDLTYGFYPADNLPRGAAIYYDAIARLASVAEQTVGNNMPILVSEGVLLLTEPPVKRRAGRFKLNPNPAEWGKYRPTGLEWLDWNGLPEWVSKAEIEFLKRVPIGPQSGTPSARKRYPSKVSSVDPSSSDGAGGRKKETASEAEQRLASEAEFFSEFGSKPHGAARGAPRRERLEPQDIERVARELDSDSAILQMEGDPVDCH